MYTDIDGWQGKGKGAVYWRGRVGGQAVWPVSRSKWEQGQMEQIELCPNKL